ncbi:MAG: hypothetical protein UR12_C0007G0012 [candidate division TM6 bacterium GW2011_GWF2_30_66]|nr:MAG: hypothetical protein UR12_C0007G0012 [candidate division TM6 bacterium GW2011_GWF2_30_66]
MFLSLNTKKLFFKYFYSYKAKFFLLLAFIFLILILRYIDLEKYISFDKIELYQYYLINFVSQNYFLSVLIYLFVFSISIVLFIPIAVIMNLIAGLLFGLFWGTVYVNIATVFGSAAAFLMFRYLLGDFINKKYSSRLKYFDENIKKNGASYLLSMQLFPATPVFLINTLSGLTQISLWTFIWTTSIGILPGSLVYVFIGQQFLKMESTKDILSWPIILVIVLLSLLSLLPILLSRYFNNK